MLTTNVSLSTGTHFQAAKSLPLLLFALGDLVDRSSGRLVWLSLSTFSWYAYFNTRAATVWVHSARMATSSDSTCVYTVAFLRGAGGGSTPQKRSPFLRRDLKSPIFPIVKFNFLYPLLIRDVVVQHGWLKPPLGIERDRDRWNILWLRLMPLPNFWDLPGLGQY